MIATNIHLNPSEPCKKEWIDMKIVVWLANENLKKWKSFMKQTLRVKTLIYWR